MRERYRGRNLAEIAAVFLIVLLLGDTFLLAPLKTLSVFFEKISAGLAPLLCGGDFQRIELHPGKGVTVSGGDTLQRMARSNFSYLGAFLSGAALILASAWAKRPRVWLGLLGAFLAALTLVYVRTAFGLAFGLAFSAAFIACAVRLNDGGGSFVLKLVGMAVCWNTLLRIWRELVLRPNACGEHQGMAADTGVPAFVWGVGWLGAAMLAGVATLMLAARADRRR